MIKNKNYTCEYCTFIKRKRKKMWGKRAEKPRWRLMDKLIRQRRAKEYDRLYAKRAEEIAAKMNKILVFDEIGKFTKQMTEALKATDKTFKEIREKINETFK